MAMTHIESAGRSVLAVIVSFNGGLRTIRTIQSLAGQVGYIYVVDNGSDEESLILLRAFEPKEDFGLHRVGSNMGVSFALNLGVKKAAELGFSWLLTMDQDSLPGKDMVARMLSQIQLNERIRCLTPNLVSFAGSKNVQRGGVVSYSITSGNLVHMSTFEAVGLYDEGYFIDGIDLEFSLRVRRAGFLIWKASEAEMQHEVGRPSNIPKCFEGFYFNHSPIRRYYMYRNYCFIVKKYLSFDFRFLAKLFIGHLIFLALLIFFGEERVSSLKNIVKGIRDGIVGKQGPAV